MEYVFELELPFPKGCPRPNPTQPDAIAYASGAVPPLVRGRLCAGLAILMT